MIEYGTERDENGYPVGSLLTEMVNGAWLDAQQFPPLEEIVPGVITEGFGLLVSPPKAGKSWMVSDLGLACSAGGFALGKIPVKQRPVLYLALEDGHRRLQSRFRVVMQGGEIPRTVNVLTKVDRGSIHATIAEFLHENRASAPLVVLDTLGRARPQRRPGDDPYIADYQMGSGLKALVDAVPGSGLLAVHHSRKAESADFVDAVSGTQGIAGAADYILVLSRKRKSEDAVLAVTGRDVEEREIALRMTGGRWLLDGDDIASACRAVESRRERASLGDRSVEVLDLAEKRGPIRAKDVADALAIDQDQARVYLNRLADAGRLVRPKRGLYTTVTTVTSVTDSMENVTNETDVTHLSTDRVCQVCGFPMSLPADITAGHHISCGGKS